MDDIQREYEAALLEIEELKNEIHSLRLQIKQLSPAIEANHAIQEGKSLYAGTIIPIQKVVAPVHHHSRVEEKLALYRSLFRGREDVYPVRWSGKQGKSGYSPACDNEWTPPGFPSTNHVKRHRGRCFFALSVIMYQRNLSRRL